MSEIKEWLNAQNPNETIKKENMLESLVEMLDTYATYLEIAEDITIDSFELINPLDYDSQKVKFEGYANTTLHLFGNISKLKDIENWFNMK